MSVLPFFLALILFSPAFLNCAYIWDLWNLLQISCFILWYFKVINLSKIVRRMIVNIHRYIRSAKSLHANSYLGSWIFLSILYIFWFIYIQFYILQNLSYNYVVKYDDATGLSHIYIIQNGRKRNIRKHIVISRQQFY